MSEVRLSDGRRRTSERNEGREPSPRPRIYSRGGLDRNPAEAQQRSGRAKEAQRAPGLAVRPIAVAHAGVMRWFGVRRTLAVVVYEVGSVNECKVG